MEHIETLKKSLMQSHWPKCDTLTQQLTEIGTEEAKLVLIEALKAKRHHIRTAAIKGLVSFEDNNIVEIIRPLLGDPSYETRMEAKKGIKTLTGEEVLTSRGE